MCGPGARRQRSNMPAMTIGACNANLSGIHGHHGDPEMSWSYASRRIERRVAAAADPDIRPRRLQHLSEDPHQRVRAAAATNPSCPPRCLGRLTADDDIVVRRQATLRIARIEQQRHASVAAPTDVDNVDAWLQQIEAPPPPDAATIPPDASTRERLRQILGRVVQQPPAEAEPAPFLDGCDISWVLAAAAASPNPHIRAAAASQAAAVPTRTVYLTRALCFLIRDDVGFVRAAAIAHPRTEKIVLIQAQRDPDDHVRAAAAGHHRLGRSVCCRFAADRSERVQLALAANPAVGPCCARTLTQSPNPEVRRKLASNPATSAAALEMLVRHDPDLWIRLDAFCGLVRELDARTTPADQRSDRLPCGPPPIRLDLCAYDGTEFRFRLLADGWGLWRIEVLTVPDYRHRSHHPREVHLYGQHTRAPWVCWSQPIHSEQAARRIAQLWADATVNYVTTGCFAPPDPPVVVPDPPTVAA